MSYDTMESFKEGRDECLKIIYDHCRVLECAAVLASAARARQLREARQQLFNVARQIRRKVLP